MYVCMYAMHSDTRQTSTGNHTPNLFTYSHTCMPFLDARNLPVCTRILDTDEKNTILGSKRRATMTELARSRVKTKSPPACGVYVYVCVCVCVYMCVYVHACVCVCVCTYMRVYT